MEAINNANNKERQMNLKLTKLMEQPAYTYKGVVYTDGIKEQSLSIIPKTTSDSTLNAKCQFKKCLFKVEMQAECKWTMYHKEML